MKRLFISLGLLILSSVAFSENTQRPSGSYITEDFNTRTANGMIKVTYTFVNDSLYIDAYPTGCGISAMSIKSTDHDYIAKETIYSTENPDKIEYTIIYHLEFLPCVWDKHSLAVYRDGSIVDIIRKIP